VFVCSGGTQQLVVKKAAIEAGSVDIVSSDGADYLRSNGGEGRLEGRGLQSIVGCGYPKAEDDVHLLIVNGETREALAEDRVGEIWVTSPSKALGFEH